MNLKKKLCMNLILSLILLLLILPNVQAASLFDNVTVRSTNVFSIETLGASVGETFTQDGITYEITVENKYVKVIGSSISTGILEIPSQVTNDYIQYTVTSIGEGAFRQHDYVNGIIIPNTVTSIEKEAFAYCDSLTSITIPKEVTNIGEGAFSRECIS